MKEQLTHAKEKHALYFDVAPGIWGTKDIFVNMYMVQNPDDTWVLIDAGLKSSYGKIKKMAAQLFGADSRPQAILLTHGHFDHVGSLLKLADEWNVPIYAHYLELPYLSGKSAYPPPDPTVGGGLMSSASWVYPKKSVNVEHRLHILPPDGSVPFLEDWTYIYTPGHAPGHVSFFREKDRVLIAGDAFVTTKPESAMSVLTQRKKISGPPKYFTYDWEAAGNSVKKLADLAPRIVASGHGKPMTGSQMRIDLTNLAVHFDKEGVPKKGRYVDDAAIVDANGVMYVPPKESSNRTLIIAVSVAVAAAGLAWLFLSQRKKKRSLGL